MIPQRLLHPYPVVMVHGGNQTGTNFTGTPDGREGWAQYFVRRGYSVYVVDQVARGRSPYWSQVYGPLPPSRLAFVQQRFVAPELTPMWPQAHLHNQFPGDGSPGDANFHQFYASQFPSIASFPRQQQLNRDALVALLDKIGPAILLTHSQSGAFGWPVADERPTLVKAILAVEPSGPPVHDIENLGPPDWFKDAERTKISGLGDVPIAYDPPLGPDQTPAFVRAGAPGRPGLVRCWRQQEPARRLVNLAKTPVLMVTSEASYHAPYDDCTAAYLAQAGVPVRHVHLADLDIRGNGHMMMIEKNNQAIAAVMVDWLDAGFPVPPPGQRGEGFFVRLSDAAFMLFPDAVQRAAMHCLIRDRLTRRRLERSRVCGAAPRGCCAAPGKSPLAVLKTRNATASPAARPV